MPLAAVIIPGLEPGASAVRSDGAAAPERTAAAGAFDALLGDAVAADARPAGVMRMDKDAGAKPDLSLPFKAHQDVRFGAGLIDRDIETDPAAADEAADAAPAVTQKSVTGGMAPPAEPLTAEKAEPLPAETIVKPAPPAGDDPVPSLAKAGIDADAPMEVMPAGRPGDAPGDRPAQSAIASGEIMQIDADRAPAVRNPGVRERPVSLDHADGAAKGSDDAVRKPVPAPETGVMPAADSSAGSGLSVDAAPEVTAAPAAPAPAPADGEAAPPPQAPDAKPQPEDDPEVETGSGAKSEPASRAPEPAQAPVPELPANAASARRESDTRRIVKGADAGKAGDDAARPVQTGAAKAQEPAAPPASAPVKPGAPEAPVAQRAADAFQTLLQAQTRPGGEAAAQRASDLPFDPSGDAGLRNAPDRATEILRPPSLTQAGAPPRFAPQTVQTLAAQIVRRQGEGGRVFDIRLDPPELGRVGVRLEMGKDQMVKAMLSAERPDTLQELQRTARDLERALAEAGLTLAENGLSFSLGGERGERDGSEPGTPQGSRSVVEVDVARPGAPVSALYGFALARAAGLDIQA